MPVWRNWASTVEASPDTFHLPGGEDEVVRLVKAAAAAGHRIKVVGGGHSFSDIAKPREILMSLDRMSGITAVDPERTWVDVRAGMRLTDLNDALAERGLALPIVGSVGAQSVAGVIATGTHGSSMEHGNISSHVRGARLVTGTGEILDIDQHDPRLHAVQVHLGALGILTSVRLAVVPAFRLVEVLELLPYEEAAERLLELGRSAEFVKLWWLPYTRKAALFRYHRTDAAGERNALTHWVDQRVVNDHVFRALMALASWVPPIVPRLNQLVAAAHFRPGQKVARSDHVLSLVMPPVHYETESSLPLEEGPGALLSVKRAIEERGFMVNFILEARFVPGDSAWMSPAHGRDSLQLGAYCGGVPDRDPYFSWFQAEMTQRGGRPHWGKTHHLDSGAIRTMWPETDRFSALARELDPDGVFHNDFVERVLGSRA